MPAQTALRTAPPTLADPLDPPGEHLWEAQLLHRDAPRLPAQVAGLLRFDAASATAARATARAELRRRTGDREGWSLGHLRPIGPDIAEVRHYRVTFARWREVGGGYVRDDVLVLTLRATDAQGARCFACEEARARPDYEGAWRIREVRRVGEETGARGPGRRPPEAATAAPARGPRRARPPRRAAEVAPA